MESGPAPGVICNLFRSLAADRALNWPPDPGSRNSSEALQPPSVNRLLGSLWAGHTLYPAVYPEDLRAEARDFYRRFYGIELDDGQFEPLSQ